MFHKIGSRRDPNVVPIRFTRLVKKGFLANLMSLFSELKLELDEIDHCSKTSVTISTSSRLICGNAKNQTQDS